MVGTIASAVVGLLVPSAAQAAGQLCAVEHRVRQDYPNISHVAPSELQLGSSQERGGDGGVEIKAGPKAATAGAATPATPSDVAPIIVDVREAREFAVSHLPGAIRVAPSISVDELLESLGNVSGRKVVLYCSVGFRSSKLAQRAHEALTRAGASSVVNMSGGIFRWHNEGRPLSRGDVVSSNVHPYNWRWGRLLTNRSQIRYSPAQR